ncbi:MAG: hypothetical protein ACRC9H_00060 [Aeromonas veronii]
MATIETFEIESGELTINVSVVCYECFDGFSDQWEGTDKHKGGVTITNLEADRNSWKFFIPKQYSLSQLTADYTKQGRENPSAAAYQSLQDQLQRDIYACDYGFKVSVYVCGVELVNDVAIGCGFDHSMFDTEDLITAARRVWDEYDTTDEAIEMAKKATADILASVPTLTEFAN